MLTNKVALVLYEYGEENWNQLIVRARLPRLPKEQPLQQLRQERGVRR